MIIWKHILECYKNNMDIDNEDIVDVLKMIYGDYAPNTEQLLNHIEETLSQLYRSEIIIKEEHGLRSQ